MDIREFLEDYIDLIDQNNFTELYSRCVSENRGKLTMVLYECGINPLEYMTEIPTAYAYMADIHDIRIPTWINRIGDNAFFYCKSLTSITIPDSVTSIGGFAFDGCNKLGQIIYNGTLAQWPEIRRTDTSDIQDVKIQCVDGVINA